MRKRHLPRHCHCPVQVTHPRFGNGFILEPNRGEGRQVGPIHVSRGKCCAPLSLGDSWSTADGECTGPSDTPCSLSHGAWALHPPPLATYLCLLEMYRYREFMQGNKCAHKEHENRLAKDLLMPVEALGGLVAMLVQGDGWDAAGRPHPRLHPLVVRPQFGPCGFLISQVCACDIAGANPRSLMGGLEPYLGQGHECVLAPERLSSVPKVSWIWCRPAGLAFSVQCRIAFP